MAEPEIRDNRPTGLLEAYVDGQPTGRIVYFTLDATPAALVAVHTVVEPEHEGKGIAGALVREFYAMAAREGVPVVPLCPYAAKWAQRHPDEAPGPRPSWCAAAEAAAEGEPAALVIAAAPSGTPGHGLAFGSCWRCCTPPRSTSPSSRPCGTRTTRVSRCATSSTRSCSSGPGEEGPAAVAPAVATRAGQCRRRGCERRAVHLLHDRRRRRGMRRRARRAGAAGRPADGRRGRRGATGSWWSRPCAAPWSRPSR